MSNLKMTWAKHHSGTIVGDFWDANGTNGTIAKAQFHDNAIFVQCGHGSVVLTPEMAAELALILGYYAYSGDLPEPEGAE